MTNIEGRIQKLNEKIEFSYKKQNVYIDLLKKTLDDEEATQAQKVAEIRRTYDCLGIIHDEIYETAKEIEILQGIILD